METQARNLIPSGIEPVDKLLGGLENGQLYLVHGEASGKSLFAIKFLIEGLKRGENGALVIRYSLEDTIRRFARLGYNCLEDLDSGRLLVLEHCDDMIDHIARLRDLTPVLRDLEWELGKTRPERLVFDPITHLVTSEVRSLGSRVHEFAAWGRSFGATTLLIANGHSREVVQHFNPLVEESFRFEVREIAERATRFISFEKSPTIADQAIEVDPSRGVFLLGRAQALGISQAPDNLQARETSPPVTAPLASETAPQPEDLILDAPLEKSSRVLEPEELNTRRLPPLPPLAKFEEMAETTLAHYEFKEGEDPLADIQLFDEQGADESLAEEDPDATDTLRQQPVAAGPQSVSEDLLDLYRDVRAALEPDESASLDPGSEAEAISSASAPLTSRAEQPVEAQASLSSKGIDPYETGQQQADSFSDLLDELAAMDAHLDRPETQAEDINASVEARPAYGADALPGPKADTLADTSARAAEAGAAGPVSNLRGGHSSDAESGSALDFLRPAASQTARARARAAAGDDKDPRPMRRNRASDIKIESAITARAVEVLLRPPEVAAVSSDVITAPLHSPEAKAAAAINPKDFNVLVIEDDPVTCETIAQTLDEYSVEVVHDGVSGLARLITFKPDLVVLDLDLPIVDGFKILAHIRASLSMPILIVSGSHVRASDRVLSAELGADYYLTKPFSVKELRQKARQLIARYRGISSWIANARLDREAQTGEQGRTDTGQQAEPALESLTANRDQFTRYADFAAQVDKSVRAAIDDGTSFSIVGCAAPNMTAYGGRTALQLFDLVCSLVRDSDLISTNPRNDIVVLLADADATGARAFTARLRERMSEAMNLEPSIWIRSFPELEEADGQARQNSRLPNSSHFNRRNSDNPERSEPVDSAPASTGTESQPSATAEAGKKPDPRESYIDFLERNL